MNNKNSTPQKTSVVSQRPGGGQGRGPGSGGPMGSRVFGEKPKDIKKTLKRLIKYIGSNKHLLYSLILMVVFVTALALIGPYLQGIAIDTITIDKDKGKVDIEFNRLYITLAAILGTYLLSSVFSYFQGILAAKLSQNTVKIMRRDLFAHIIKLPVKYMDNHPHGDIMSRMTNDVDSISNTISQSIGSLFSGVLTIIGTIAVMLFLNWFLTAISFISVILTIVVTAILTKFMKKYFKQQQTLLGQLNGHVEEVVTGYKTVTAYAKEEKSKKKFNKVSNDLKKAGIKAQILGGIMGPIMGIINNLSFLLICGFGGWLVVKGETLPTWLVPSLVTVGTLQIFIQYTKRFARPIVEIANLWAQVQSSMAAAERVFEIMDSPVELDEGTISLKDKTILGDITFDNVSFSYVHGEQVLKNFSLEVKPGQKIALVGATGSGKTTVVNLLMRFYDADSGTIAIDGININDIPKDELRQMIAIVLQDTVLFSETIEENIRYGRLGATFDEIVDSAAMSNSNYFIERLPDKYSTLLSESGGNLSHGERQLLAIARAIIANPKILILDEATSSVDTRTEMNIQDAMAVLMKNRTSLIIAHRLSTIQDADLIIVIDQGEVVEKGNHRELLAKKGRYFDLYQTQFAGKEI